MLARHAAADGALPVVMLQHAVESQMVEFVAENFQRFAPDVLSRLQQRTENAPPQHNVSHALEFERKAHGEWLIGRVQAALAGSDGDESKVLVAVRELFHQRLGWDRKFTDEIIQAAGGTSAGMIAYTKEVIPAYDVMRNMAAASPENLVADAERTIMLIQQNSNLLVRAMTLNVCRARSRELETLARLAMLQAGVAYKKNGPAGLKTVRDPFGDGPFEMCPVDRGLELRSKLIQFGLNGSLVFVEKDVSH